MMNVACLGRALSGAVPALLLVACAGSQNAALAPEANRPPADIRGNARGGCPTSRCIVVADIGSKPGGAILFFPRSANGNVPPIGEIKGSKTQLDLPSAIEMDSAGNIYAANRNSDTITVYSSGSLGNVAPIRTISGSNTQLDYPTGIAFDRKGNLYVVNFNNSSITVYAPNADGDAKPIRTIVGGNTMMLNPWGIALDSKSNIYVAANFDSVAIYPAKSNGNVSPERFISGSATQLSDPQGIAVDASGYTYVANWEGTTLAEFAPDANGNVAPARQESNLYAPDGVALDAQGKTYVSNGCQDDPDFVDVFAAGANNAQPLRTITGSKTKVRCVSSILVR